MIRSIEELVQPSLLAAGSVSKGSAGFAFGGAEEQFYGWAPEVQILTENDLKKIEKQEERKARYDKRKR